MASKRRKAPHDEGFRLRAKSYANPDFDEDEPRGPDLDVEVRDPPCAVRVYLGWIRQHGLGGGNAGDGVVTVDGEPLARISYNGRLWRPGPYRSKDEPMREPTHDDFVAAKDPAEWRKCLLGGR